MDSPRQFFPFHIPLDRRRLLRSLLLLSGGVVTNELYAEALLLTPRATEGPYYPDHLPLDRDNNLVEIEGQKVTAGGVITEFGGRLLTPEGRPVSDCLIELWQADQNGCYLHSRGVPRDRERDPHFQGYGTVLTNEKGEYRFRTIRPGKYPGRTLHWHLAVNRGSQRLLTTQLYLAGVPENDGDGVLRRMGTPEQQLSVICDFQPAAPGSEEWVGAWDIVVGETPEEPEVRRARGN
jgi:protocatechuate 3,4-dioxygenase beta subunit